MKESIYFEAKAKKSTASIETVIDDLGIIYPNDSLGFLHAVYAKLGEANRNNVMLAESVKEDIPKLRFTQANQNHKRQYGPVLGCILAAWLNEETQEIEIVFSFYKSLYPKLWEEAQKLLEEGKLTVSFELKVEKADIEVLSGGVRKLHRVDFDGVGLLMGANPAYKNAFVLETAMQAIEQMLNQEAPELVFANAKEISQFWTKVGEQLEKAINDKQTQGGKDTMDKVANDVLLANFKEQMTKE